ncbi:MAG: biotin synthase BioB [Gammaproteobacteria bacterium]|nr:biotin synthase BioB [Gammaproteobacteria bacterium]
MEQQQQLNWDEKAIHQLYELPFSELIQRAYSDYKENFDATKMELCTLLSIKTGVCPEDCAYCSQSGHYKTGLKKERMFDVESVIEKAKAAKANGAKRFCMAAAWRNPPKKDFPAVIAMVKAVKELGLQTCVSLGTADAEQLKQLKEAGLDYYNHNLDTSPEHYKKIITTRSYEERLNTLDMVQKAGIHTCCGAIMGMGESRQDRVDFFLQLLALPQPPTSVPINRLMPMKGTPLENTPQIDNFEFIRTVAVARILLPTSKVRLSAGRDGMSEEMQALCFMAGANSMFYGEKLLTGSNPANSADRKLLRKLGMTAVGEESDSAVTC